MPKDVVIIGAGGHSKVIADIIAKSNDNVVGFLDDNIKKDSTILGFPVLGNIAELYKFTSNYFIIGIGNNHIRKQIAEKYTGIRYYTAIHPTVVMGIDVKIEEGTCIMANTVINVSTSIGKHCILNTGAILEHDNEISNYVHISPNVTLCGTVRVGEITHIGAGSVVKNNVSICSGVVIGAGGVVVKDIIEEGIYVGIPIRRNT